MTNRNLSLAILGTIALAFVGCDEAPCISSETHICGPSLSSETHFLTCQSDEECPWHGECEVPPEDLVFPEDMEVLMVCLDIDSGELISDECGEQLWFADTDEDTFGDIDNRLVGCRQPDGYVENSDDCDDGDSERAPNLEEGDECDGIDNDCDGVVDNGSSDTTEYCLDEDGDSVGAFTAVALCAEPARWSEECADCDDTNGEVGACGDGFFCSSAPSPDCIAEGSCLVNADCENPDSQLCRDSVCVDRCDSERNPEIIRPNILFALERSASMNNGIGGTPKWEIAATIITDLLADPTKANAAEYNLVLYPDREVLEEGSCQESETQCSQSVMSVETSAGTLEVPGDFQPESAELISSLLTATIEDNDHLLAPGCPGRTRNPDCAMAQVRDLAGLAETDRASYVVLITTGVQGFCSPGATGCPDAAESLSELYVEQGVQTFVLAFGSSHAVVLREWAEAGGVDYEAIDEAYASDGFMVIDNTEQFRAALWDAIGTTQCEVVLSEEPTEEETMLVFVDGNEIAEDSENGWQRQGTDLTFSATACDLIRESEDAEVEVVYTCAE